mmetsp:Transcript_8616/g.35472  ORF Transcript_8616/g.35472 Transcript_8616/m.35472 type:complete len:140 (+) Transcript_8616:472-891(+)
MNKGGTSELGRADNKRHQMGEQYHNRLLVKLAEHRTKHPQKAEFDPTHPDHRTIDRITELHCNACELSLANLLSEFLDLSAQGKPCPVMLSQIKKMKTGEVKSRVYQINEFMEMNFQDLHREDPHHEDLHHMDLHQTDP